MFSWHTFLESYPPILEKYGISQVYQCYDELLREEDIKGIRENLSLLDGYEVYLLSGDPAWGAEDMLKKAKQAVKIGGFDGVVFDVEPDEYDASYVKAAKEVCGECELPVIFCVPYWIETDICEQLLSFCDGLLVMNYDKGDEYENISALIPLAEKYDTPLATVYELQPPDEDTQVTEQNTYDGDADAAIENFAEQFAGTSNVGIAYHYIKYIDTRGKRSQYPAE